MVFDDLQGSIALCRDKMAEQMPFGIKTKRIIYRYTVEKIDKFTVRFVS